jgi:hypothetical protein
LGGSLFSSYGNISSRADKSERQAKVLMYRIVLV